MNSFETYEQRRAAAQEEREAHARSIKKVITAAVVAFVVFLLAINCIGVVPRNHVGILIRAGVVQPQELTEGWKAKIPVVDKIESMSNEVQTLRIATGDVDKPTTTETAETKDRQLIPTFEFEIQYQLSPDQSFNVYKNYGKNYETRLITNNATAIIKQVFSFYNAEEIVEKKAEIPVEVAKLLNEFTAPVGIEIKRVNMKTYDFTAEYTAILEERAMLSAQLKNNEIKQNNERIAAQTAYDVAVKESEKMAETNRIAAENAKEVALLQAQQESETRLIRAEADAEANKISADNDAYVMTTRAEADKKARLAAAEATKAELEAQASGLNDLVIQRQFIDKWNGQLLPNFGGGNGLTFTDMTEIIQSFLPKNGGVTQ